VPWILRQGVREASFQKGGLAELKFEVKIS
jgi:hypothetical protein